MADINLPSSAILNGDEIDVKKLRNYLSALSLELEYALSNIGKDNMTSELKETISKADKAEKMALSIASSVNIHSAQNPDGGANLSIGGISLSFGSVDVSFETTERIVGTATSPLNIRVSPSISSESLGLIKQYDSFTIDFIENGWAHLTYEGKTGYSSMTYIQTKTISSKEEQSVITVPITVPFLKDYALILSAEGTGNFWVVLNKKNKNYFTATIYRSADAPRNASVNWVAFGIRK